LLHVLSQKIEHETRPLCFANACVMAKQARAAAELDQEPRPQCHSHPFHLNSRQRRALMECCPANAEKVG
jgi:hypothetical protein